MDSALACCAGGTGLISAIGKSNVKHSNGFSPSRYKVVDQENGAMSLRSISISILGKKILLTAPSMGEHSVSQRNGKKQQLPFH